MKSKTTVGGLLSAIGLSLSGGGILAQLTQMFPGVIAIPNSVLLACWFITLVGVVMKIVGVCITAYFAADDSDLQAVKRAVAPTIPAVNLPPPTIKLPKT
jgi:hypothetical protein